jgi:hypothetical protein
MADREVRRGLAAVVAADVAGLRHINCAMLRHMMVFTYKKKCAP